MKLNELHENPNNPSKCTEEQLNRLAGKLKRVPLGLTAIRIAYVTDTLDGHKMVISGNKRLRVLKKAYGDDAELPDEYFQDVTAMTEAERKEFIVTANVNDGEWDLDKLLDQYDNSTLNELMGQENVDKLIEDFRQDALTRVRDIDGVPKVFGESESKIGKIYQLGKHRLICGDSTKKDTFDKLLECRKADLVLTDPPYNINIRGRTKDGLTIKNDNMQNEEFQVFLDNVFSNIEYILKDGGVFYVWYSDGGPDAEFELALRKTSLHQSMPLVWVKSSAVFSMGRLDYNRRHEVCKFGWKLGAKHYFCNDRTLNTLIQDDTPDFDNMKKDEAISILKEIYANDTQMSVIHEKKPSRNAEHPTMKPVNLFIKQILNSSKPNDLVVDMFLGSGTSIIACEETHRICYGVEYDPHYCDVIRKRYAEYKNGEGCDWKSLTPELNMD